jgi:uncharacterized membrane protein HdeD (DUF308 family)
MEISVDRSFRHWWVFLIRGILFILVGIYMIASPADSFITLGFLFGLIVFLAGLVELLHVVRDRDSGTRGWHLFVGIVEIILGIVLMGHVATSIAIMRIILGLWFLFRGISMFSFSGLGGRSWILVAGGILTVLFALLILFSPSFGAMTIILWTAIAFIIIGFFNVMLSLRLKRIA